MPKPANPDFAKNRRRFMELAEALCRELGACPPPRHQDDEPMVGLRLEFDGEVISLVHADSPSAGHLLVHCHLMLPIHEAPDSALMKLLNLNHALGAGSGASFCIDPNNGEARYTTSLALSRVQPPALLRMMKGAARLASQWRTLLLENSCNPHDAMAFGMAGRA
jgi:hypothetical protein